MNIEERNKLIEERNKITARLSQFKSFEDKIEELSDFKKDLEQGLTVQKIETSGSFGRIIEVPWTLKGKVKDIIIEEIDNQINNCKLEMEKI